MKLQINKNIQIKRINNLFHDCKKFLHLINKINQNVILLLIN